MITKVVGVTFCNEDGSSRARIIAGMTDSDKICLERDPYNQYDSNAVKVCVLKNGEKKQIGFLPKDIAANVSSKLRRNIKFDVTIQGVGLWNDRPFCEIEIRESVPAQTVSEHTTSRVSAGPTFTPNKSEFASDPTFTPNRPASTSSESSPAYTPTSQIKQTESNVTNTTTTTKASFQHTQSQPNNSGCLGIIVLVTIVISTVLAF